MSQPLTLAAVDCGTNSIRLLITRFDPATNMFEEVCRENIIVRLGQGVDETGALNPEAIERTRKALATYTERMLAEGCSVCAWSPPLRRATPPTAMCSST